MRVVILNASSGFADKHAVAERLREMLPDVTIRIVEAGTDIRELAREAVRAGAEAVIAGGGDGTVRAVASEVAGTETALGVLPVGTLNHFARDLEMPLDLEAAARVLAAGRTVSVDVAQLSGHVFINNAVIGLYPNYRHVRDWHERFGRGRRSAMLLGWAAMVRRYPFLSVRLRTGGQELERRTPFVMIANNEHAMRGLKLWQRAAMTEGELFVYLLRDTSRLGLLRATAQVAAGRIPSEFDLMRASDLWVELPERRLAVSLDGEIVTLRTPLHCKSRPRDLRVIVPETSRRVAEFVCELPECAS